MGKDREKVGHTGGSSNQGDLRMGGRCYRGVNV